MRISTSLTLPVTLLSLLCFSVAAVAEPDANQEFIRLEEIWNQAHLNNDVATLETLWADDLTVIVPSMATMGKAEALSFVKSGRMKFSRYETTDLKVRSLGDTASVTGKLSRSRTVGGSFREDRWRFMKVYAMRSGKWVVVAFTATEAPGP